jgi:uncharacterized membrane protein
MENSPHTNNHTSLAALAYILFFIPLLTKEKENPFVLYHVKQGFTVFTASILLSIMVTIAPLLFYIFSLAQLGIVVLVVIGIMNAIAGKKEPIPLIGHFSEYYPF